MAQYIFAQEMFSGDIVTASITGAAMALGSGAFAAVVLGAMLLVASAIRRMKFFAHWSFKAGKKRSQV